MRRLGIRDFWKRKAGKAQIVTTAAWIIAVVLALEFESSEALIPLSIFGAGMVCFFLSYGFWEATRKVKKP